MGSDQSQVPEWEKSGHPCLSLLKVMGVLTFLTFPLLTFPPTAGPCNDFLTIGVLGVQVINLMPVQPCLQDFAVRLQAMVRHNPPRS